MEKEGNCMTEKEKYKLLSKHVDEQAHSTVNDGWELDSLVFWNQVSSVEETTGMDIEDAYDQVASHYSLLSPSHVVLKGKGKKSEKGWTLDYNMLVQIEASIEKRGIPLNEIPSLEQIEDVIIAYNHFKEKDTP